MEDDSEKAKEIEEIRRRIDYLLTTDQISISDKIAIARRALEIIEGGKSKEEMEWALKRQRLLQSEI